MGMSIHVAAVEYCVVVRYPANHEMQMNITSPVSPRYVI